MRSHRLRVVLAASAVAPTDLLISEYVEGSSNNKAIEIFNGTAGPIDLGAGGYVLQVYFNGNTTPGGTFSLNGSIASGDVFVFAAASAAPAILAQADATTTAGLFNGNDAVVLRRGGATGAIVDSVGRVGVDPGAEWGTGLTSTADNTLRRLPSVQAGDTNPAVDWSPGTPLRGVPGDHFVPA